MELKTPPHSIEAEQAVLGALMIDLSAWDRIGLVADDFYRRDHRVIFNAIASLCAQGQTADVITVMDKIQNIEEAGGGEYVGSLPKSTPSSANIGAYANVVKTKAAERRLLANSAKMADLVWADMPLEEKIDKAGQLASEIDTQKQEARDMKAIVSDVIDSVEARFNAGGPTGLVTGYIDLDKMLNGLQASDMIVLAARPSMGKTSLAMNIVENVSVKSGKRALIFSMEMSDTQLIERSHCSIGRVDYGAIQSGKLGDDEWARITAAMQKIVGADLVIDDTGGLTVSQVRSRARKLHRENPLDLIVIDYIQLMRGDGNNRNEEISGISRGIKSLAKELDLPVIVLSQLNRASETRPDKRPVLSDLRESGSIEQDADVVMFIYREEMYKPETHMAGIAEILIRKQRRGRTGMIHMAFNGNHCRFDNFAGPLPLPPDNGKGYKYD